MSISRALYLGLAGSFLVSLGAGCLPRLPGKARPLERPHMTPAEPELWLALADDGDPASLAEAVEQSLSYFRQVMDKGKEEIEWPGGRLASGAMEQSLASLLALLDRSPSPGALAAGLRESFSLYRIRTPGGVLFTGYYHPLLTASLTPDDVYRYPIWGRPIDLVSFYLPDVCRGCPPRMAAGRLTRGRLLPYFSRAEIEAGALRGRARAVAWAKDPLDVIFLQIQGSGSLLLPDGRRIALAYAGSNGRPYRSIGRRLVDTGKLALEGASADGVRRYLAEHPREAEDLLRYNPRYVFFRVTSEPPAGSLGVRLTPGRSVAADPQFYPPGALAFIRTRRYQPATRRFAPLARFVLSQDTGAAIGGAGRVDIYWGEGDRAGAVAGRQRTRGELFVLLPKGQGG